MIKGYTGGSFVIPHFGHYNFFRLCKLYCDYLVISLNTDEFILQYKGYTPEYSYQERENILKTCPYIDEIIPNEGGQDSKPAILSVHPNVILIGSDWLSKDYCKQMSFTPQWLTDHKISLCYLPYTEGVSTSDIKSRLK